MTEQRPPPAPERDKQGSLTADVPSLRDLEVYSPLWCSR